MEEAGDEPWLCHLSYIKPHWPYIVPAPYHDMYGPDDILPAVRSEAEKATDHPVFKAYIESRICRTFARDEVRERVIPAYMGLIKQLDDQLGVLFAHMEKRGMFENTMIVFTSDHGDYLGDHWMGEKDLFHEQSVRVPMIIYDPRPEADTGRGTATDAFMESIDLAPTFIDFFGGAQKPHIIEGKSLTPLLNGTTPENWRTYAISEYDYATRPARLALGTDQETAQLFMIRDQQWKFIHAVGYRPILFDLENDPDELTDLGASPDPAHEEVRRRMRDALFEWACRHHSRITRTPEEIENMAGKEPPGVLIGFWDEEDLAAEGLRIL
jgi:arylsulfatase A-like enzyme